MKYLLSILALVIHSITLAQQAPAKVELHPVSSGYAERDFAISPDGTEMMYTLATGQHVFSAIVIRRKHNGKWSEPVIAPFSGQFRDLEPAYSYDGSKIYFSSNRPVEGKSSRDFDIWFVEKVNSKWSTVPVNLGPPVNTDKDEFYPSVTKNGKLYFTAEYKNGVGKEDIFVSTLNNNVYSTPTPLDTMINSKTWEFNAFVSPDDDFIIFTSYGRRDEMGGGDLYISTKDKNNQWQMAKPILMLNSKALDYCPYVSIDRKALYFTSQRHDMQGSYEKPMTYPELTNILKDPKNGTDNIYWISFDTVFNSVR